MRLDLNAFLQGVGQVAQGQMQGKIQAQQELEQKRQQDFQLQHGLEQEKRAQDQQHLQFIWQHVLPHLSSGAQKEAVAALTSQSENIANQPSRAGQALRPGDPGYGFYQGLGHPQQGVQPAAAVAAPPPAILNDLNSSLAGQPPLTAAGPAPPPPAGPHLNPSQLQMMSRLAGAAGPMLPGPFGQVAQQVQQGAGQLAAGTVPPPAPPAAPNAAAGGVLTPEAPKKPSVMIGGKPYELGGVDAKQLKEAQGEWARLSGQLLNVTVEPNSRASLQQLINGVNTNPEDEEGLQKLRQSTQQLRATMVGMGPAQARIAADELNREETQYTKTLGELQSGKANPAMAASKLVGLLHSEQTQRLLRGPDKEAFAPNNLEPWSDDIEAIDKALKEKTPEGKKRAAELSRDVLAGIINNQTPQEHSKTINTYIQAVGKLSVRDNTPKRRFEIAQSLGIGDAQAKQLASTNLGGAAADKAYQHWLDRAKGMYKEPEAVQRAWVDEGKGIARATGRQLEISPEDLKKLAPEAALRLALLGKQVGAFDNKELRADAYLHIAQQRLTEQKNRIAKAAAGLTENAKARLPMKFWEQSVADKNRFLSRLKISESPDDLDSLTPEQKQAYKGLLAKEQRAKTTLVDYFAQRGTTLDLGEDDDTGPKGMGDVKAYEAEQGGHRPPVLPPVPAARPRAAAGGQVRVSIGGRTWSFSNRAALKQSIMSRGKTDAQAEQILRRNRL